MINVLHTMEDQPSQKLPGPQDDSPVMKNADYIRFRTNESQSIDLVQKGNSLNKIKVLDLQSVQNAQNLSKLVSIKSQLDASYQTHLSPSQKPPSVWDQMANHDA